MEKIVTNPNKHEQVELGKDTTCFQSGYKGWGTQCEKLVLGNDGYYHCLDCGLVKVRPILATKFERPLAGTMQCECRELDEFCEMIYDDFFDYAIPHNYYRCTKCQLVYCYEDTSYAPLEKQESEAAKRWVKYIFEMKEEKHKEELRNLSNTMDELKSRLGELNAEERKRLLEKLNS